MVASPRRPRFQEPRTRTVQLVAGADRIALCGRLDEISHHRHAAPAIVVGIDAPLSFLADRVHTSRAALLSPGFGHAVRVPRGRIAVFLLPPHALAADPHRPIRDLPQPGAWRELGTALLAGELADFSPIDHTLSRALAREHTARPIDDRLRAVLARTASQLDDNLAIADLAASVRLSPQRLMGLARDQLGTSLRSYRRWLRMFRVARDYAGGTSLTDAAHAAGFASSAHLSAASRESFGIRPSDILASRNRGAIQLV
jgi:AraC-like DNA-binding protein